MSVRVRVCSRVPHVTSHYLMCVVNPLCVVVEVEVEGECESEGV